MNFDFSVGIEYFFNFIRPLLSGAIALLGVGFLIAFHEFGHFILCKLFGVKTPTFSIGAGPRIFTCKIKDTDFVLSALPVGGFVEIAEKPEHEGESNAGYFISIPYYQKMLVIIGGIFCNILLSWIIFVALFSTKMPSSPVVYPAYATTVIDTVAPDSPAQKAGLVSGDVITEINSVACTKAQECIFQIEKADAGMTQINFKREGLSQEISVELEKNASGKRYLGVVFEIPKHSFLDSLKNASLLVASLSKEMIGTFAAMFKNKTTRGISGPIMLVSHVARGASSGWQHFLLLLAFISLNLALLNLLPIPVMDGGQALFYTIEAIIRRPLPDFVKFYIRLGTWLLLLVFIVYLSVSEIIQLARSLIGM